MSTMQAGYAKLEMTPPMGVPMEGYFYERLSEGVMDPLYVHAVAFKDGEKTAVVLTLDLCAIPSPAAVKWAAAVGERLGIPAEAVLLHATHTHTAPTIAGLLNPSDEQYEAWLLRRICDTAWLAVRDCKPVEAVRTYQGRCPGVSYPRRLKMKDGRYQTWAKTGDPEISEFACDGDDSLRLVRILREKADEIVLVNFQSHPDNISNSMFSADFPGFLRDAVEAGRPGVHCVYFNGAEGELIVHDYINGNDLPKYVRAQWAGRVLAEFVLAHLDMAKAVEGEGIAFGKTQLRTVTKRDPNRIPEALRLIDIHENGDELNEIGPDWVATPLVAEAYVLRMLEEQKLDFVDIPVSAVAAGGLAFVGIAGEPFSALGRQIRRESPYAMTFVCACANGYEGYYSTAEAYDQGGYEPANARYPKGVGEDLTRTAADLLHRIREA